MTQSFCFLSNSSRLIWDYSTPRVELQGRQNRPMISKFFSKKFIVLTLFVFKYFSYYCLFNFSYFVFFLFLIEERWRNLRKFCLKVMINYFSEFCCWSIIDTRIEWATMLLRASSLPVEGNADVSLTFPIIKIPGAYSPRTCPIFR